MPCFLCGSGNLAEFNSETNIHFSGLKNLDRPSVLVFPQLLVCLDCGFTGFTIEKRELGLLREGDLASAASR